MKKRIGYALAEEEDGGRGPGLAFRLQGARVEEFNDALVQRLEALLQRCRELRVRAGRQRLTEYLHVWICAL